MKRLRKVVLLTLLVLCVAFGGMIAGCGKKKVTISFDTMGGDQAFESVQVKAGEDFVLQIPTRNGYEFTGWYDNQSLTGTAIMGGTVKAPENDTTYYASWSQLMKVTLDANGGAFADGSSTKEVYVAKGKKLMEALDDSEYMPTRGSLQFGAWFAASGPIGEDSTMPAREIKLTARYSVSYFVEIYKQLTSSQYEHDASLDFSALGFFEESTTVEAPPIEGYEFFRNHPKGIPTLELQEDSSKNLFKLYYNKQAYTIIYNVNAPEKMSFSGFMADQKVLHGEEGFAMECGYSIRSYRFAGWAKSAGGNVEIKPGEKLPEGSYTLYAVWDAGYSDAFGGTDFIYFPHDGKDGSAILQRGNAEIIGRTCNRDAEGNYTEDVNGMYVKFNDNLIARLVDSNPKTFSFFDNDLKGEYLYYDPYLNANPTINESIKLTLDGFEGGVILNGERTTNYKASMDESGYYRLTRNDGTYVVVLFGMKDGQRVFSQFGGEAGTYQQFNRVSAINYAPTNNVLNLDGFGNASWGISGSTSLRGKYEILNGNGQQFVSILFDDGSEESFIFLDFTSLIAVSAKDDFAGDYTYMNGETEDTTRKLTLDGFDGFMGGSYYEDSTGRKSISYMVQSDIFGEIISVIENNQVTQRYSLDVENHHFSTLEENYTIHRYLFTDEYGGNNISNEIFLVIYDEKDGEQKAKVVKSVDGGKAKEILTGTVAPNEENKPLTSFYADQNINTDHDFPYTNFMFYVSDKFTVGSLFYVYTYEDPDTEEYEANFLYMTPKYGGNQKMLVYAGLNTFEAYGLSGVGSFLTDENGEIIEGSLDALFDESATSAVEKYFDGDNFYSFSYFNSAGIIQKRYFAVYQIGDDAEKADYEFQEVNDAPRTLVESYGTMEEGSSAPFAMEYSLFFDGRGNALILMETAEGSQYVTGNYTPLGLVNELEGYRIKLNDGAFNGQEVEIVISGLNSMYYYRYNGIMEGHHDIEGGGYVELDGWGTHAKYVDNFGHEYEGYYCFRADQTGVLIYPDMQHGIAEISIVDGKFVNTPPELSGGVGGGLWNLVDQNMEEYLDGMPDAAAHFDGEGGVTIEHLHDYMDWMINGGDGNKYNQKRTIYGRGYYTALSEDEFELEVGFYGADGSLARTEKWRAKLAQGCCIKLESTSVGSYVQDTDKAVLYLDGYGEGFYVDARGNREDGNYQFVDKENNVCLFMNMNCNYLFKTDSNHAFRLLNDPDTFRSFYADDMTSLEFSYALRVDGQQIGVWYFDDNNDFVYYEFTGTGFQRSTEYHYPTDDTYEAEVAPNVRKTFKAWKGDESDKKVLTGKIEFRALKEAGKEKSSIDNVTLTFTPDGTVEINADAVLTYTDTIKNDGQKTYENIYTVKKIPMATFVSSQAYDTYELFLCYGEMQFPLNVKENTFTVWADIDADRTGVDLLQFLGNSSEAFAKLDCGDGYSLGVRKWSLKELGVDVEEEGVTLLGGYANVEDENGDLICFEVLWHDDRGELEEKRLIGTTTETGVGVDIPIYEIFTRSMDDDKDLVVLLELMPKEAVGESLYFTLYAACNYVEVGEVSLPNANGGKDKTDQYRVFEDRAIGTSKGFAQNGVAYFHVYRQKADAQDTRHEGYEEISNGFSMFLQSSDYMLVENVTSSKVNVGSRAFLISPEFVQKDTWDQDKVTLWFGITKHVEAADTSMKDGDLKDFSYDIIFLTNQYREKDDKSPDSRPVLDGWLTFLYYHDSKTGDDFGATFRFGYSDDGKTRISRVGTLDGKKAYDLKFKGTVDHPEIEFTPYVAPPEEDEEGSNDEG